MKIVSPGDGAGYGAAAYVSRPGHTKSSNFRRVQKWWRPKELFFLNVCQRLSAMRLNRSINICQNNLPYDRRRGYAVLASVLALCMRPPGKVGIHVAITPWNCLQAKRSTTVRQTARCATAFVL